MHYPRRIQPIKRRHGAKRTQGLNHRLGGL